MKITLPSGQEAELKIPTKEDPSAYNYLKVWSDLINRQNILEKSFTDNTIYYTLFDMIVSQDGNNVTFNFVCDSVDIHTENNITISKNGSDEPLLHFVTASRTKLVPSF